MGWQCVFLWWNRELYMFCSRSWLTPKCRALINIIVDCPLRAWGVWHIQIVMTVYAWLLTQLKSNNSSLWLSKCTCCKSNGITAWGDCIMHICVWLWIFVCACVCVGGGWGWRGWWWGGYFLSQWVSSAGLFTVDTLTCPRMKSTSVNSEMNDGWILFGHIILTHRDSWMEQSHHGCC